MDLSTYSLYAVVTSLFVLTNILIALILKAWFDRRAFLKNIATGLAMQQTQMASMYGNDEKTSFDSHLSSVPGLRDLNG